MLKVKLFFSLGCLLFESFYRLVPPKDTLMDIAGVGGEPDNVVAVPRLLTVVPDDSLNCNLIKDAEA